MVTADEEVISSIGRGLCVLIGISRDDTEKDIDFMWVWLLIAFLCKP